MKHFDPEAGWSDSNDASQTAATPEGLSNTQSATDSPRATVVHFNRNGSPLHVGEVRTSAQPTAARTTADTGLDIPGNAAAVGESIDAVFGALNGSEETSAAIAEVSETLRCLSAIMGEKQRLENELSTVNAQLAVTRQALERNLATAQECELRALEAHTLRVELVRELAASLTTHQSRVRT